MSECASAETLWTLCDVAWNAETGCFLAEAAEGLEEIAAKWTEWCCIWMNENSS